MSSTHSGRLGHLSQQMLMRMQITGRRHSFYYLLRTNPGAIIHRATYPPNSTGHRNDVAFNAFSLASLWKSTRRDTPPDPDTRIRRAIIWRCSADHVHNHRNGPWRCSGRHSGVLGPCPTGSKLERRLSIQSPWRRDRHAMTKRETEFQISYILSSEPPLHGSTRYRSGSLLP